MTIIQVRKGFLKRFVRDNNEALEMFLEFLSDIEVISIGEDGSLYDSEPMLFGNDNSLDLISEELIELVNDEHFIEFITEYKLTQEYLDYQLLVITNSK